MWLIPPYAKSGAYFDTTEEHPMKTNHTKQIRMATIATVAAFVVCASTTSPAFAAHTHGNGDGDGGSGTGYVSPYAEPIAALDGMTLARYIQMHQAGDRRTATVV